MEYEYNNAEDKQQRMRTIIITTAIAVIVLGIAAWAIIDIVGSRAETEANDSTTQVALDDATSREKAAEEQPAPVTEGVSKTTEEPAKPAATQNTAKPQSAVPETGPEELLPLALVCGLATAFVASKRLARAKNIA